MELNPSSLRRGLGRAGPPRECCLPSARPGADLPHSQASRVPVRSIVASSLAPTLLGQPVLACIASSLPTTRASGCPALLDVLPCVLAASQAHTDNACARAYRLAVSCVREPWAANSVQLAGLDLLLGTRAEAAEAAAARSATPRMPPPRASALQQVGTASPAFARAANACLRRRLPCRVAVPRAAGAARWPSCRHTVSSRCLHGRPPHAGFAALW